MRKSIVNNSNKLLSLRMTSQKFSVKRNDLDLGHHQKWITATYLWLLRQLWYETDLWKKVSRKPMSPWMSHSQENNTGFQISLLSPSHMGRHDCGKWYVLLSCPSFITHMHFWRNKNRELIDSIFFMAPLQTRLPLGLTLPVHTCRSVAKETQNKDDFLHWKQENASAPQIFIHYHRLTVSILFLTEVLKNRLKALHIFFFLF